MVGGFVLSSTSHENFIYGSVLANMTCVLVVACAHRQTPAYLNKHTQTMSSILKQSQSWRALASCFTISSGCYVQRDCYLYLRNILFTHYDLLSSVRGPTIWLQSLSAFQNRRHSSLEGVRAAPTPSLPLCSLKRLPQLASFLMMRAECLLLSVLLSKQFPRCGLPLPPLG